MTRLRDGAWEEDPAFTSVPSDEQVEDYAKFIHKMSFLAANGEPERKGDVNYLRDGVWEFKVADKRIAFYDTDGHGNWTPKGKILDIRDSPDPSSPCWWFPEMDIHLRLLNAWPKVSQRAEPADMDAAVAIAREDVSHDGQGS
jgi:hypothetical protein